MNVAHTQESIRKRGNNYCYIIILRYITQSPETSIYLKMIHEGNRTKSPYF